MKTLKDFVKIFLGSLPKRKNKAQRKKLYHGYNLKRVMNIMGAKPLMEAMRA
jgi:hypothetical protein